MFKKKLIFTAIIAAMAFSAFSCGTEPASDSSQSSSAATTAAEETTTAETTTAAEETTTEAVEETTTEAATTEAATEATDAATGEAPTNQELLRAITQAFGIVSDGSFQQDVEKAKSWDIINKDEELMADAPATPEFLISSCIRAASFADGNTSMDEIASIAVKKGIITDTDLSKIDMTKAMDIVEKAAHAWTHQTFDNEVNITLNDDVVDLNGVITADEWNFKEGFIQVPTSVADMIKAGGVFILPKKSTGEGGAYKATSVATVNGEVFINAEPAE